MRTCTTCGRTRCVCNRPWATQGSSLGLAEAAHTLEYELAVMASPRPTIMVRHERHHGCVQGCQKCITAPGPTATPAVEGSGQVEYNKFAAEH